MVEGEREREARGLKRERFGHHYILLKRSKCNSAAGQNFESASARVPPRCVPCAIWGCMCVRVKGRGGGGGGGGGELVFKRGF